MRFSLIFITIAVALVMLPLQAVDWIVPLQVCNGDNISDSLQFGIHPNATDGLDAALGEVNLPPLPPLSIFETRFLVTGYEGFELDLRNSNQEEITYILFWQAGDGGYPITVSWDSETLPPGDFFISDIFEGYFTGILDMNETEQITILPSQPFITRLQITVYPQQEGNIAPELDLPSAIRVYSGQRVPYIYLEDCVSDYDNTFEELSWDIQCEFYLNCEISNDILHISYPADWTGNSEITITVTDPQNNSGSAMLTLNVLESTVFNWEVDLHITEGNALAELLSIGINEDASEGIDSELGEINLPPIPPAGQFDARFILPDGDSSLRDIRESTDILRTHELYFQPVNSASNCLLTWNPDLPPGNFILQDGAGGYFFDDLDMRSTNSFLIPLELNNLFIAVTPVIDTEAPTIPQNLDITWQGEQNLILGWEPSNDENFSYYEIFIDSVFFAEEAQFIYDHNDDNSLSNISTASITLPVLENFERYYVRMRAWDLFGNVSLLSQICSFDPDEILTLNLPDQITFPEDTTREFDCTEYIELHTSDTGILNCSFSQNISVSIEGYMLFFSATENWNGSEAMIITLESQNSGNTVSDTVLIVVEAVNDAPFIDLPSEPVSFNEDNIFNFWAGEYAYDIEDDILTYSVSGNIHLTVNITQDTISFIPDENWYGNETVIITVDDGISRLTDSDSLLVNVLPVNDPPFIDLPASPLSFNEDENFSFWAGQYATDIDDDNLEYYAANTAHIDVSILQDTMIFIPEENWFGSETITIIVDDGISRLIASDSILVIVLPVNDAPIIDLPSEAITFDEDNTYNFWAGQFASDIEDDSLTYSVSDNIHLSVSISQDIITFFPEANWFGTETVIITVDDGISRLTGFDSLLINVLPINDPPVIEFPDNFPFYYGDTLSVELLDYIYDLENDPLEFFVLNNQNLIYDLDGSLLLIWSSNNWTGTEFLLVMANENTREYSSAEMVVICHPLAAFYGDIDLSDIVDAFDAALVLRYVVGMNPGPEAPLPWEDWRIERADVDGNDVIDAYDASLILQFVCEIILEFPCQNLNRQKGSK